MRLGPLRLRSVPWYWDILWERLSASSATPRPSAPTPVHHDHYCEDCDGSWIHDGHTCATAWAFLCRAHRHGSARKPPHGSGPWLIVVRRERAELCRHLGESFKDQGRVTVLLDRRQSERRGPVRPEASIAAERRRYGDRRAALTPEDRAMWTSIGFLTFEPAKPMKGL